MESFQNHQPLWGYDLEGTSELSSSNILSDNKTHWVRLRYWMASSSNEGYIDTYRLLHNMVVGHCVARVTKTHPHRHRVRKHKSLINLDTWGNIRRVVCSQAFTYWCDWISRIIAGLWPATRSVNAGYCMNWPRPTRLQLSPERRRESFEYKISVVVGLMYTGNEEKKT